MYPNHQFLLTLGALLLLGLVSSTLGQRTCLPRVTLLLLFGMLIGEQALDLIPAFFYAQFELVTQMALLMVGFLLGGKLTVDRLQRSARQVLWISLTAALITMLAVTGALLLAGLSLAPSVLLGCIASATAPAAVLDVTLENQSATPFQDLLLSIVALDDAWALILFSLGIAIVATINGSADNTAPLTMVSQEILGAIVLGVILGVPAAYLTGRIKPGQPGLVEALGIVFVCGGLALWLNVSFLISTMVMGAVIANLAKHHDYPFHAIEDIEWPFMVVFFILAGASLEIGALQGLGFVGLVYLLSRSLGKIGGGWLGSQIANSDAVTKRWIGAALLPQAGVAIGMALLAADHFPEYRQLLLSVVISSTVLFELIGPVFTRIALRQAAKHPK